MSGLSMSPLQRLIPGVSLRHVSASAYSQTSHSNHSSKIPLRIADMTKVHLMQRLAGMGSILFIP